VPIWIEGAISEPYDESSRIPSTYCLDSDPRGLGGSTSEPCLIEPQPVREASVKRDFHDMTLPAQGLGAVTKFSST